MMVFGELPNISPSARSIGFSPEVLLSKVNCRSSVTFPTEYSGVLSRSAIFLMVMRSFSPMTNPILSWDSFPIISFADKVGSPTGSASRSIFPPVSSTNSLRQFKCPPAPWSWMETIGFSSASTIARMVLAALFCISGLERCTALSSIPLLNSPVSAEETAAPPIPIR